jgi:thioredoxin
MNENVKILTEENFDKVIGEDKVSLVDFSATWCGPCKMFAPTIDDLATSESGKTNVCKLDVDVSPEIAERYGIMSVPTVLFFKKGELKGKSVGVRQKTYLEDLIKKYEE